jgi:high-affinity iron transporter
LLKKVGTVLGYVFYWIAAIVVLIWMKFQEVRKTLAFFNSLIDNQLKGRVKLFGRESAAGINRRNARAEVKDEKGPGELSA